MERAPDIRGYRGNDVKPPFAYYGGKIGLARRLIELMPRHRTYLEPFAGSLALLFAKPRSTHEIVNDLDDAIITFFRVLREQPKDLERVCALTPYARTEYQLADLDDRSVDDLERARRFWVRVHQSFARTAGRRSGWSITKGQNQSHAHGAATHVKRFAACAARLQSVAIENCDAVELIERMADAETLIYVDPPYLGATRVNPSTTDYRCDLIDEVGHKRVAEALHSTAAAVMLSGYPSPLYEELYGDWWSIDFPRMAHTSNAVAEARASKVERVWSNRELAVGLFAREASA